MMCVVQSPATLQETGSVHDETSSSGNKEDEDEDEEEIDDLKTSPHDPERLKAFNVSHKLFSQSAFLISQRLNKRHLRFTLSHQHRYQDFQNEPLTILLLKLLSFQ